MALPAQCLFFQWILKMCVMSQTPDTRIRTPASSRVSWLCGMMHTGAGKLAASWRKTNNRGVEERREDAGAP
jgi:hypothetical protein